MLLVLERQHGLDQPGHAGRGVEMADVGLDRADRAEAAFARCVAAKAPGSARRSRSGRRARCRCRAPRRSRSSSGSTPATRQRLGDHRGLPADARRGVADLQRAVVVDRRALDHRVDRVAVGQRVRQPLQHHDADAAAEDRALRLGVEGAAVAIGRDDPALAGRDSPSRCGTLIETPPASAMSHSPFSRLWQARWTATSEVEQAVWTVQLGPRRLSLYDTRVVRKSLSLPTSICNGSSAADSVAVGRSG